MDSFGLVLIGVCFGFLIGALTVIGMMNEATCLFVLGG